MSHVIGTPGAPCPGPRRFPSGVRVVIPPAVPYPLGHPVRTVNGVLPDEHGDIRVADATATERGLMSAEDKAKLDGVEAGAEVNAVATVKVDGTALVPDEGRAVDIDLTGKADKATTLAGYGITDARIADGTITLGSSSITPLTQHQSLAAYVNGGSYDSNAKKILLKHDSTTIAEIDATAFIKDGMVSSVAISSGKLVVTFNTDAGKEPVEIPLTDIFNPANYYDKTAADAAFVAKVEGKGLSTEDYTTAEKTKLSGIETGAEVNVIGTVKVNGTALTPDANKAVNIDLSGKQDTISDLSSIRSGAAAGATAYQKPSGGIPASDLAAAVQTSLGKADTALQQHQDISGKADAAALRYDLPTNATAIDTASQETVGGETVNYGEATLADRTGNRVSITATLDELRVTFPPAVSGKLRDFGLRVEVGTGSAALTAPALVPVAPTGETIKLENNAKQIPALADGTATAKGVTLLYFSESAPGVFFAKGEQVGEVA